MVSRTPTRFLFAALLLASSTTGVGAIAAATEGTPAREEIQAILARQEVTLLHLFRLAELTNPTLAAARSRVAGAAGRTRQAGLYPNPTLEFEFEDVSTEDPGERTEKVSIEFPIIWSGRRGDALDAARAGQQAASQSVLETRRELLRHVHSTWAELLFCRESEAALDPLLDVAQATLQIAQARFDARAVPESHVTRALLEVYELEVEQQRLVEKRIRAAAELTGLLGGTEIAFANLSGPLTTDDAGLSSAGATEQWLAEHPALIAAEQNVEAMAATLAEARAARLPDLHLFTGYGRSRGDDQRFVEGGLALSLPLFDRNQGRIAERRASLAQARHAVRIVESDLAARLAVARQRSIATRDQLDAYRGRIVPAAERGIAQAQDGYRAGRLPFLELIDAQRTLATVRLRNIELARDLVLAAADLMSLVGSGPYANQPDNHQAGEEG